MSRNRKRSQQCYGIEAWCEGCQHKLTGSTARYARQTRAHLAACVLATLPCPACKQARLFPVVTTEDGQAVTREERDEFPIFKLPPYERYLLVNAWQARRYRQQVPSLKKRIERLKQEVEKRSKLQAQRREEMAVTQYVWDIKRHDLSRVNELQMDLVIRNTFRLLYAFTNSHPTYRPPINLYLKDRPVISGAVGGGRPRSVRKQGGGEWESVPIEE